MTDLISVGTFKNPLGAHMAKGRLEAEGIEVFVANEHHVWAYSDALGEVSLQVAAADVARAEQILKAHLAGEYEAALQHEFPEVTQTSAPRRSLPDAAGSKTLTIILLILFVTGLYLIYSAG